MEGEVPRYLELDVALVCNFGDRLCCFCFEHTFAFFWRRRNERNNKSYFLPVPRSRRWNRGKRRRVNILGRFSVRVNNLFHLNKALFLYLCIELKCSKTKWQRASVCLHCVISIVKYAVFVRQESSQIDLGEDLALGTFTECTSSRSNMLAWPSSQLCWWYQCISGIQIKRQINLYVHV